MKYLLLLFLFFTGASVQAQYISGLYAGKLTNDSNHREQQYELALNEYRGQISGYAYTTFIVRDTFYYSVKKVKATRDANMLLVEDVKMLANNFPEAPNKGVRQQMRIPLVQEDTLSGMNGTWNTTRTKVFYSIGGSLQLKRANDSSQSALIRHLYEINELSQPDKVVGATAKTRIVSKQQDKTIEPKADLTVRLPYTARAEQVVQSITVRSDSVVLSFYDNGVVDGDTISVFLNKQTIINKTRLTAGAATMLIRLQPGIVVHQLMLVAENLGTIPPNTGLLVVQDGERRYQVHFTADLQHNAVINIRKE